MKFNQNYYSQKFFIFLFCPYKNSKSGESMRNNFMLEIIESKKQYLTPALNTDTLICLAVKRVGCVGRCAGTIGWVGLGL